MIGMPERFACAKQIASYVGLFPAEESSGDRRRLGHIRKQGNALLRHLLVEAPQVIEHGVSLCILFEIDHEALFCLHIIGSFAGEQS